MSRFEIALENDNNEMLFKGEMSNRIDDEVCRIVAHCEQLATRIIRDNRVIIDLIVERLLEAETIDGSEFRSLLEQYTIPPTK